MSDMYISSSSEAAAREILDEIEDGQYRAVDAYGKLKQIINDLPGTSVANEAQAYLDNNY